MYQGYSHNETQQIKRDRNVSDSEESVAAATVVTQPTDPAESSSKRSRGNAYIAPRTVPKTLVSVMGSLAPMPTCGALASTQGSTGSSGIERVGTRRLSGGNIHDFLGDHDAMDVDNSDARPRSMSF